jgi:hypothetical protein
MCQADLQESVRAMMEELQQWRAGYPDRGSPMRFENDNSPGRSNNHPDVARLT